VTVSAAPPVGDWLGASSTSASLLRSVSLFRRMFGPGGRACRSWLLRMTTVLEPGPAPGRFFSSGLRPARLLEIAWTGRGFQPLLVLGCARHWSALVAEVTAAASPAPLPSVALALLRSPGCCHRGGIMSSRRSALRKNSATIGQQPGDRSRPEPRKAAAQGSRRGHLSATRAGPVRAPPRELTGAGTRRPVHGDLE